MANSADIDLVR